MSTRWQALRIRLTKPLVRLPVPPQTATIAAASSLAMGGLIGYAVGPSLPFIGAAAPQVVQLAGDPPADASSPATGGSGGSGSGRSSGGGSPSPNTPAAPTPPPDTTPPALPPDPLPPTKAPHTPNDPDPASFEGPVVRVNPVAGSYVIAADNNFVPIHASKPPEPGDTVAVNADQLANGTYEQATKPKSADPVETATVTGVVTDRNEQDSIYTLSDGGASVTVQVPDEGGGDLPARGAGVTATMTIEPVEAARVPRKGRQREKEAPGRSAGAACTTSGSFPDPAITSDVKLVQSELTVDFESLSSATGGAVVQASCPDDDELIVSADDIHESGRNLDFVVSADEADGVDLSALQAGDPIVFRIDPDPEAGASYELFGFGGDLGADGADDKDGLQGSYP